MYQQLLASRRRALSLALSAALFAVGCSSDNGADSPAETPIGSSPNTADEAANGMDGPKGGSGPNPSDGNASSSPGDNGGVGGNTDDNTAGAMNGQAGAGASAGAGGDMSVGTGGSTATGGSTGTDAEGGGAGAEGAGAEGGGAGTGGAGASSDPQEKSTCDLYCEALFGAQCPMGPPTLEVCIQGCEANPSSEPCDKALRPFVQCQLQFYPDDWECQPTGLSGPPAATVDANCADEKNAAKACLDDFADMG